MSPKELREFLFEIKTKIEGINKTWLVVDDSQLGNSLEQRAVSDNAYLVGVLPSYDARIRNADSIKDSIISQILILEKTDYSELSEDDFIDVFERTYQIAKAVKQELLAKVGTGCFSSGVLMDITEINIVPIWKKSQCNGWSIDFSIG